MAARAITSMPRPKGLPAAVNFNPSFVSPHHMQLGVECHRERHRRHKDSQRSPLSSSTIKAHKTTTFLIAHS